MYEFMFYHSVKLPIIAVGVSMFFTVISPGGALYTLGIMLIIIAAVAVSPAVPYSFLHFSCGFPSIVTSS